MGLVDLRVCPMSQLSLIPEPTPRAIFSPCREHGPWNQSCELDCTGRVYRYELEWPTGQGVGMCLFVLANPSTATHLRRDHTVTRCINYARAWGYAWAGVANARAWRETNPKLLPPDPLAIGPDNDLAIHRMATRALIVVCGWGKLGGARGPDVLRLIRSVGHAPHALRLNDDGSPEHPLFLPADLRPFPMEVA
jgi:hypothetical protein